MKFHGQQSLLANTASNWAALAINMALGFALTPFILKCLGMDSFGVYLVSIGIVGYFGVLDLGVSSAVSRYVARFSAQKDYESLSGAASTALFMFAALGVVASALSIALASPLAAFQKLGPKEAHDFKIAVYILGPSMLFTFLGNAFSGIILGLERYMLANAIIVGTALFRAVFIVVALKMGTGLVGASLANLINAVAILALSAWFSWRVCPRLRVSYGRATIPMMKALTAFGFSTMLIGISDILRTRISGLVVARWLGVALVPVYGQAVVLVMYGVRAIVATTTVLMPRFSQLDVSPENKAHARELLLRSLGYSSLMASAMLVAGAAVGRPFFVMWLGPAFEPSYLLFVVILAAFTLDFVQVPGVHFLRAANKHHMVGVACVLEGVANLALSVILVPRMGVLGVAVGLAIPMAVVRVFFYPVYVTRVSGVPLWKYVKAAGGPLALSFLFVAAALEFPVPATLGSWPLIFGIGGIYASAYVAAAFLLMFPRAEWRWAYRKARLFVGAAAEEPQA